MRKYLKELREEKDLTQVELAEKLGMGQNSYSRIENGLRQESIKLDLLTKLSQALDVDLEALIQKEMEWKGEDDE